MTPLVHAAESFRPRATEVWWRSIPWVWKGSLAILDQGLIAGTNFLLNILLARWLAPEQYGVYALAFAGFLFLAALYDALLLEPMAVLGPVAYQSRRREYLGALLGIQGGLGVAVLVLLGTTAAVGRAYSLDLTRALAGLAVAAPCILLFWLARGACYLDLAPGTAVRGALLYAAVVLGGLWVVYRGGRLSPFSAFLLMGGGSLVVALFLLARCRPTVKSVTDRTEWAGVWKRHWAWGRWELGASVVNSLTQNISYVLAGAFLGMAEVGALKALMNLALPVNHTTMALRRLAQPYVSGVSGEQGYPAARGWVRKIGWLFAAGGLLYFAAISGWREPVLRLLYGGNFTAHVELVPWVALCVAISSSAYGFMVGLRAVQRPASILLVHGVEAVVLVGVGLPATWLYGLPGMIGAGVASSLSRLVMSAVEFRRVGHE